MASQWRGKSFIGGGRKSIWCALFVSALTAKRHNKAFKAFVDTLLKAGKPKMVAMIAVARKLLTQINATIRDNAPWAEQSN